MNFKVRRASSGPSGAMDCYIYILGNRDGRRTYVGWTLDLDARLKQHNAGIGAKSTRGRQWDILYAERHPPAAPP